MTRWILIYVGFLLAFKQSRQKPKKKIRTPSSWQIRYPCNRLDLLSQRDAVELFWKWWNSQGEAENWTKITDSNLFTQYLPPTDIIFRRIFFSETELPSSHKRETNFISTYCDIGEVIPYKYTILHYIQMYLNKCKEGVYAFTLNAISSYQSRKCKVKSRMGKMNFGICYIITYESVG